MKDKFKKIIFLVLTVILILSGNFFVFPQGVRAEEVQNNIFKLLVKFQGDSQIHLFSYSNQENLDSALQKFQKDPKVEIVENDSLYQASYIPNDLLYREQWALARIKAPQAWDLTTGSTDVVVAVLDTGVDLDHPDLKNNIWRNKNEIPNDSLDNDGNGYIDDIYGWDFIANDSDPQPDFNSVFNEAGIDHGTIIAGLISASGDNVQGITGVSFKSKIMSLRVLNNMGVGDTEAVIRAVNYAIEKKVDVINMSFVGNQKSTLLYEALKKAYQSGIVIVAASGNDGAEEGGDLDKNPLYPVCLDEDDGENFIIGVAASDLENKKAKFSSYGKKCIDISAPGVKAYSTLAYNPSEGFNEYYGGYWSGSSVAAPLVSGTAALIKATNPQLSPQRVTKFILDQTDEIDTFNPNYIGKLGRGVLNTYKAVRYAYLEMARFPQARYILTAPGEGMEPQVRLLKSNSLAVDDFLAYDKSFRGGVNIATGDVNGDGQEEIITGANKGGGPHVRIFSREGKLISQFFAFDKSFRGGINVAVGDVDGDKIDEIIVAPQSKGGPQVRIFDKNGRVKSQFFAYDRNFRGGVSLAVADLDGDGRAEIITGPLSGGGPQVKIFNPEGIVKFQFFAYLQTFVGGIKLAAGDVDGDGNNEIIVGIASGASPYLRVFDYKSNLLAQFLAYDRDFYGGINIAVGDLDYDGKAEIITGPAKGGGPHLRIFDDQGNVKSQFFAYDKNFRGGMSVATISSGE